MEMSQPFFSSRKWIKVWINEWREGTLRWQATDSQRAFWIDLLTLAGRSRYPGIVCAGMDSDKTVGYPAAFLAPNSGITAESVQATLDLFVSKNMVSYSTSKSAQGDTLYAVTITNWKKYQSDYDANRMYQRNYRARKKASSGSTDRLTSQLDARKTLDLEVDLEKEKETHKERDFATPAFERFWQAYPMKLDRPEAIRAWHHIGFADKSIELILAGLEIWKASERWQEERYILSPTKFLRNRRWEATPPRKAETKHEQGRRKTKEAIERIKRQNH